MTGVATVPVVEIELDGQPLSERAIRCLTEVRVVQRLSLPTMCELRFTGLEDELPAASAVAPGAEMRVSTDRPPLFRGDVTALEWAYGPSGGRELRVRGYDRLHRLRKRQPVRSHVQVSAADLARELVSDLGLSVDAHEEGPVWDRVFQVRQSDWELLLEVAEKTGLFFVVRDDVLHLLTLDGIGPAVPLTLGQTLFEASVELNSEMACRQVTALGWDPHRAELHDGNIRRARVGRDVGADTPPQDVGGSGERTLVDLAVQDDRQTEAEAQADLDVRVAREVVLEGVADGDPELRPGARVEVTGLESSISGRYVLTSTEHVIGDAGYTTRFSSSPPSPRGRFAGTIAALGEVTAVDDPDGLGRLRVTLPTYGELETDWVSVVMAGAGEDKGLVCIPDVGDRVLVLLARGDPGQALVVGGLYGTGGPPEETVEGGSVRAYTLRTRGGQRIRLDDTETTLRLETSQECYLEMSPERVALHSSVPLDIEAPGQAIRIRGASIDFESG